MLLLVGQQLDKKVQEKRMGFLKRFGRHMVRKLNENGRRGGRKTN